MFLNPLNLKKNPLSENKVRWLLERIFCPQVGDPFYNCLTLWDSEKLPIFFCFSRWDLIVPICQSFKSGKVVRKRLSWKLQVLRLVRSSLRVSAFVRVIPGRFVLAENIILHVTARLVLLKSYIECTVVVAH